MKPMSCITRIRLFIVSAVIPALIIGCATTSPRQQQVSTSISTEAQKEAQAKSVASENLKQLRRKIAIGRFTNESRYGKSLLVDANNDPLGKQASDMLMNRLVESQKFVVLERPDLEKIKAEQKILGSGDLVGADAMIIGSITEFGRGTAGKVGFLSSTKIQTARAKVEVTLVDVKTGEVFFASSGVGEASTESGEIAGFGSRADYDATLNDRAIGAAISDLIGRTISKLEERPWHADILKVDGSQIYISGGERQGLKIGDSLGVYQSGEVIKSSQTGFNINLPPKLIAKIKVVSLFGSSATNEGAVTQLISGGSLPEQVGSLFIGEDK